MIWLALAAAHTTPAPTIVLQQAGTTLLAHTEGIEQAWVLCGTEERPLTPSQPCQPTGVRASSTRPGTILWMNGTLQALPFEPGSTVTLRAPPSWARRGAQHLLEGPDHIAMVAGLTALASSQAEVVKALLGFTLGHAAALTAIASGAATVLPGTELLIALSLVLLGRQLVLDRTEGGGFLAAAAGLVHGMGFAGGLAEQLGTTAIVGPVVSFHIGLEAAQLLVAALAFAAAQKLPRAAFGWVIGIGGTAWAFAHIG